MDPSLLIPAILGNIGGSSLAGFLGGGSSNQPDIGAQITQLVNTMNGTLNDYMNKAIQANQKQTNKAINTENTGLTTSNQQLQQYLASAQQQAQMNALYGLNQSRAYATPAISAGNTALDSYMDSLGLSRPTVGYGALQQAATNQANYAQMLGNLGPQQSNPGTAPTSPGAAPDLNAIKAAITPDQIKQFIKQKQTFGPGGVWQWTGPSGDGMGAGNNYAGQSVQDMFNNPSVYNESWDSLAQSKYTPLKNQYDAAMNQYNTANSAYQNQLQNYNTYQQGLQNISPYAPTSAQQSLLQAYNSGLL